jgi:hypothetical protein
MHAQHPQRGLASRLVRTTALIACTAIGLAVTGAAHDAKAVVLPTDTPGLTHQVFGDFNIFSLQYLRTYNDITMGGGHPGIAAIDPFLPVQSAPGQIHDDVVIATGAGGTAARNSNNASAPCPTCDDAFDTPGGMGSADFFEMDGTNDPDPDLATDTQFFDIDINTLRAFLDMPGGPFDLTFFFNLNEEGNDTGTDLERLNGQSLLASARVSVIDDDDASATQNFYLGRNDDITTAGTNEAQYGINLWSTDTGGGTDTPAADGDVNQHFAPDPDPSDMDWDYTDPRWAFVHGNICVDDGADNAGSFAGLGDFLHFGACGGGSDDMTVSQNLGANEAAFAANNADLTQLVLNSNANGYDRLEIEFLSSKIGGGYEQLFIRKLFTVEAPPPEPVLVDIHGLKWFDEDGDGIIDMNEPGLNGWVIQLLDSDMEFLTDTMTMSMDDTDGLFWFTDLELDPGQYYVCEVQQEGYEQTFPDVNNGCQSILFTGENGMFQDINFGNWIPPERVPEPAALAIFGIGLAGLGALRRRKRAA